MNHPLHDHPGGLPAPGPRPRRPAPALARVGSARPAGEAPAVADGASDGAFEGVFEGDSRGAADRVADLAADLAAGRACDGAEAPDAAAQATLPAGLLSPELVTVHDPRGVAAEAFRTLRSRLAARSTATWDAGPVLAVVGVGRGGGRSWCAANLAVSMAQRAGPVLLIDANLRRPRLHRLFGLPHGGGLAAVLAGQVEIDPVQPVPQVPGLFVMAAGDTTAHPLELLEQPAFGRLLQALGARFVHVVVDTPAAAEGADAAVITARCDAALLVTRRDHDALADVQALLASFDHRSTPVAGVLLNTR